MRASDVQREIDRMTQNKQEPVAVVRWNDIGHISWRTHVMLSDNTPLYTTPPQRKPLTDEEIWEVLGGIDCTRPMLIARAIEAAHGIKGEA